jgi:hypothetical protein
MSQFTYRNRTGIVGAIAVGMAIAISSFSVVRAEHMKPDKSKTYSCSSGTACVEGNSTGGSTWGVYGMGAIGDGVHGITSSTNGNSGTSGISTGTTGSANGVYGRSSNGPGVYGIATGEVGTAVGGVEGRTSSAGQNGVYGYYSGGSNEGDGVFAESNGIGGGEVYPALYALGTNPSTYIFTGYNSSTGKECGIDPHANLTCSGTIKGGTALLVRHHTSSGQHVLSYASESATATIEDVGTARMFAGVANVAIPVDFASVMDRNSTYYVFLTPLGDTRGFYVSIKTPSAFQVRETERGRDTLSFDYRIVAHPFDAENDRLPLAPAMRRPRIMRPAQ